MRSVDRARQRVSRTQRRSGPSLASAVVAMLLAIAPYVRADAQGMASVEQAFDGAYRVQTFGSLTDGSLARYVLYGGPLVNASGSVVGYASANGGTEAVLGTVRPDGTGTLTGLGRLPGGESTLDAAASFATAINDRGLVAGYSSPTIGSSTFEAFVSDPGDGLRELGFLPGQEDRWSRFSIATGINAAGRVVGYGSYANQAGANEAFITGLGGSGGLTPLGFLPGVENGIANGAPAESRASAVNDAGRVVGYARNAAGGYEAFVTGQNGSGGLTGLGFLSGMPSTGESYASSINDAGRVVGYARQADGRLMEAFITGPDASGGPTSLGFLPGMIGGSSYAFGINAVGQVVGEVYGMVGGAVVAGGYVWDASGGMRLLSDLVPDGWRITQAVAINDRGQIVAIGVNASVDAGAPQLVLLESVRGNSHVTPEPSIVLLLGTGTLLLGVARRWRARGEHSHPDKTRCPCRTRHPR